MKEIIQLLRESYAAVVAHRPMDSEQTREVTNKLNTLRLAEAVLNKSHLSQQYPDHATHVGILGPTQSGKSTLINLLFKTESAGVSALAGYTVHAMGFAAKNPGALTHHSDTLFADFELVPQSQLNHDNYKAYSVEQVPDAEAMPNSVESSILWDSPDFDSIESGSYRSAVLRVAAIADVCVLVVSKDKYADKSVWDMLNLLDPLNKPIIVCINKLNPSDTQVVLDSFNKRYQEHVGSLRVPTVVSIPYVKSMDNSASQIPAELRQRILHQLDTELLSVSRDSQQQGAYNYISQHWEAWLAPIRAEHEAEKLWRDYVDEALNSGLQRYQSGYLDHPRKYDTFNRALAELLVLLEVPGLADTLGKTRKIVTWPIRKLIQLGRSTLDKSPVSVDATADREEDVLRQAAQHVFSQLNGVLLDEEDIDAHWWNTLVRKIRSRQPDIIEAFEKRTDQYQSEFHPQIEAAAHKLYATLQEQPALLNSLRAARVSTDAAAVVLAVHSGGLAASDLVLAPAMLALTTMLTESALGKHMDGVKHELRELQLAQVKQHLFENVLRDSLYALPASLNRTGGLFGIDESTVKQAQRQLDAFSVNPNE